MSGLGTASGVRLLHPDGTGAPGHTDDMRTILIADRDAAIVALLREALRDDRYRIISAASAEEALILIRRVGLDLLILDTETDGFAVLERREGPARGLPVIMMGAAIPEKAIFRGWELGVDTFQSKDEEAFSRLPAEIGIKIERIFKSLANEP